VDELLGGSFGAHGESGRIDFWLWTSRDGSSLIWDDCNIILIIIVIAIIIIPVYSRADSTTLGRITGTSQP